MSDRKFDAFEMIVAGVLIALGLMALAMTVAVVVSLVGA